MSSNSRPESQAPVGHQEGAPGQKKNRPNNKRNKGRKKNIKTTKVETQLFKGTYEEMNGHVFQCQHESSNSNQFDKAVDALGKYAANNFSNARDIKSMLIDLNEIFFQEPIDPPFSATRTRIKIWEKEVDEYMARKKDYSENKWALFAVVLGQCSEAMKAKLQVHEEYKTWERTHDVVSLLREIKGVSELFDSRAYFLEAFVNVKKQFFFAQQEPDETNTDYFARFRKICSIARHYGADLTADECLIKHELLMTGEITSLREDISNIIFDRLETKKSADSRLKAYIFTIGADKKRYRNLHKSLANSLIMGRNVYPKTIADAYDMLIKSESDPQKHDPHPKKPQQREQDPQENGKGNQNEGVSLMQTSSEEETEEQTSIPIADDPPISQGNDGSNDPPSEDISEPTTEDPSDVTLTQHVTEEDDSEDEHLVEFLLMQSHNGFTKKQKSNINKNWILLDSESTCHIFNNRHLLKNIRKCDKLDEIKITSNGGGKLTVNLVGDLNGVGMVHFHKNSVANILSLAKISDKYRVTFDNSVENAFVIHGPSRKMKFLKSREGLYFHDATVVKQEIQFLQTVDQQKSLFTHRQVKDAILARKIFSLIGRPGHDDFVEFVRGNNLRNCQIDVSDCNRALQIYGPYVPAIRGKTTRTQPSHVSMPIISPVPPSILLAHGTVQLCADVCFINNLPFLVTISRAIKLRTVDMISSTSNKVILASLQQVFKIYDSRGFQVSHLLADSGFQGIARDILPIRYNPSSAGEHVPEIERNIRTLKERVRSTIHGLPYRHHPTQMLEAIIRHNNMWLNWFVARDGVSDALSPRQIVWGDSPDFNVHCKIEIGSYCEVFEPRTITNTPASRTVPAIALTPAGNSQGGYKFLALNSGKTITRNQWTELPISNAVIQTVEALAKKQEQPSIVKHVYYFTWSKLREFPPTNYSSDSSTSEEEGASDDDRNSTSSTDSDYEDTTSNEDDTLEGFEDEGASENFEDEGASTPNDSEDEGASTATSDPEDNENETNKDPQDSVNNKSESEASSTTSNLSEPRRFVTKSKTTRSTSHYDLRQLSKKNKSFRRRFDDIHYNFLQHQPVLDLEFDSRDKEDLANYMQDQIMLTQMSAKAGIKKFGEQAILAIIKEYAQLDSLDVFEPKLMKTLTKEQMAKALRTITVIKAKRCGRIKGRTVADGRPQRNYVAKEDSSSPAVGVESLFISLMNDVKEGRYVVTGDIAGAFLKATMDEFVLVKIDGEMVDYLVRANPSKYSKFVSMQNGKKTIYLRVKRALYGCVKSSLLWYNLFTQTLVDKMGFTLNPYDTCVANKIVNGKQLTILWYVDDVKVSHVDKDVVENTVKELESHFQEMTVTRGKERVYVGMHISLDNDAVTICNKEYVEEAIELFGEEIGSAAATPAKAHLFEVEEGRELLSTKQQKTFHSCVAKLLFVAKRGRPDILTAVSFLTTRVTKPTIDDWGKLKRIIQYFKGTIDLKLTLSADDISKPKTWVDASYAPHPDMKSHTGACTSFGRGVVLHRSSKQKLNTKSSTEAELIGMSDSVPYNLWTVYFLRSQGIKVSSNILFQDNQSAIKLEKNGRRSAGIKSRHINIRYFWIKDCVDREEIEVVYCPTNRMLADFFTKPLQGELFRLFRDVLMGVKHISVLDELPIPARKERVGPKGSN